MQATRAVTVRNLIALGVCAVALLQCVGAALSNPTLLYLAKATVIAPYPQPFTAESGFEAFSAKRIYTFSFTDGTQREVPLDARVSSGLTGPHRNKVPYLAAFLWAPVLPPPLANRMLTYTLCHPDLLAVHGVAQETVTGVVVDYVLLHPSTVRTQFSIVCR